jgi:hypothetical protein
MSDVLVYGALAGLAAIVIGNTTAGRQAVNTAIDQAKPTPKPQAPAVVTPKPIAAAPLPVLTPPKPPTTAPNKPPPKTPATSKKTAAVVLPVAAEPYRVAFKTAAFGQNLPFTLLVALCENVNPRFDKNLAVTDRRLLSSQAVIDAANGSTIAQENLATRYGLAQVALIHAKQLGFKGSPAQMFEASLEYGAKYLKKCLGLFPNTQDRQLRAFVAYIYGYDAAKAPNAEQWATAKKIFARWQELEA